MAADRLLIAKNWKQNSDFQWQEWHHEVQNIAVDVKLPSEIKFKRRRNKDQQIQWNMGRVYKSYIMQKEGGNS